MSETPDDAASVSGPAFPNNWTLRYAEDAPGGMKCVAERSISDEEYERYHEAVSFVLDRRDQASLKLVSATTEEVLGYPVLHGHHLHDNQTGQLARPARQSLPSLPDPVNWLDGIQLQDDHNRARIVRTYGDPSPELDAYMAAHAAIYDEVSGYHNFMFEMRNCAQHCGVVPVQAQIHQNASGSSLDLHFERVSFSATSGMETRQA